MIKRADGVLLASMLCFLAAACTTVQVEKFQKASANYQAVVSSINASIAATAPTVAKACGDLQTAAMLLAPFFQTRYKVDFDSANAGLVAFCQVIPTDIQSTAAAVVREVTAARRAYADAKKGL